MSSWTEGPTINAVRELRPLIEANRQWAHLGLNCLDGSVRG